MNRLLLICLLVLCVCSCTDSIPKEHANQDITKILENAEKEVLTYAGIETDSMLEHRMEYFHKAKTFNDSVHMYRAHFYLGAFYQSRGIYKDAMSEYEKALQNISDDADSARYIQTKLAIATTEIELGNKYKAGEPCNNLAETNCTNTQKASTSSCCGTAVGCGGTAVGCTGWGLRIYTGWQN